MYCFKRLNWLSDWLLRCAGREMADGVGDGAGLPEPPPRTCEAMSAATTATTTPKTTDPSTPVASVDPAADGSGVSNCKILSVDVMVQSSMPSSMSKSTTLPFTSANAKAHVFGEAEILDQIAIAEKRIG
jgi:hypothetical protein